MRSRFLILISAAIFAAFPLPAQITTTVIYGTVTDATGAVVPGAKVTAVNSDTNLSRSAETNSRGEYRIELLPIGHYEVQVDANGFQKYVQKGIVLTLDQIALVNATLQVGNVNETVSVTAAPPMINTSNATLGRTVGNAEITTLPIVNRNVYTLLSLTPGVRSSTNGIVLGYPQQITIINGGTEGGVGAATYYLDGGLNMTGLRNTGNILPNPDAIQEFRVDTNNYSAAYGRSSSGVINAVTTSGTNQFHGSLFEFVRNNILDANLWNNQGGKPPLHRNQFGGSVGGPIKRNKTFFFFSYQGLRQSTPNFISGVTVPTAAERVGDFSADRPIKNPFAAGTPQFSNNIIPASMQDRTAMNIINRYIPLPNQMNPRTGLLTQWQGFDQASPYNTDEFLGKVDQDLTPNQRLTASYFETSGLNILKLGNNSLPWSRAQYTWRQHNANVSHTWSVNPSMVNQAWINFTRNFGGRLDLPSTSLADLGSNIAIQGTPALPQIGVSGYFTLSQSIAGPIAGTNYLGVRDVLAINRGRHAISVGAEASNERNVQATLLNNYGVFNFTTANTANGLADFELGLPSSVSQDAPVTPDTTSWYYALFIQDDFRIRPHLTINMGLRWDVQTPPIDRHDFQSTFIAGQQSTVRPDAPLGVLFPGDRGIPRGIVSTRYHHFSPRLGFAWDPFGDGKTSIRGAAGIFYGNVSGNEMNSTSNYQPFSTRLTFINIVNGTASRPLSPTNIGATLTNPYTNYPGGPPFPYTGYFLPGGGVSGTAPDFQWPYSYQYNVSIERQLGSEFTLSAAYVGSQGRRLPFGVDLNYPISDVSGVVSTTGNVIRRRPIDNPRLGFSSSPLGQVIAVQSNQRNWYNALQLGVSRRMSGNLSFHAYYTYSKTLDSVQLENSTVSGTIQDYRAPQLEKGRADNDMRHMFVASLIWKLNYYHGTYGLLRQVANGWSIAPIITLNSGLPFGLSTGSDNNLDGNTGNDRPDVVPGVNATLDPNRARSASVAEWFNTAGFVPNAVGKNGSLGRNVLDGPGFRNIDLGIFRDFKITERVNLQFRAESTNAFNMVSLNSPSGTFSSSSFGSISSAHTMRQIQLGMRLHF
jgi:hypothetical protein